MRYLLVTKKKKVILPRNVVDRGGYVKVFEQLKIDIKQTQLKSALFVTKELILLYWRIGSILSEKVKKDEWGAKTMERLAKDLKSEFPDISGFSFRNLHYMKKFAENYQDPNYAAAAAQTGWS